MMNFREERCPICGTVLNANDINRFLAHKKQCKELHDMSLTKEKNESKGNGYTVRFTVDVELGNIFKVGAIEEINIFNTKNMGESTFKAKYILDTIERDASFVSYHHIVSNEPFDETKSRPKIKSIKRSISDELQDLLRKKHEDKKPENCVHDFQGGGSMHDTNTGERFALLTCTKCGMQIKRKDDIDEEYYPWGKLPIPHLTENELSRLQEAISNCDSCKRMLLYMLDEKTLNEYKHIPDKLQRIYPAVFRYKENTCDTCIYEVHASDVKQELCIPCKCNWQIDKTKKGTQNNWKPKDWFKEMRKLQAITSEAIAGSIRIINATEHEVKELKSKLHYCERCKNEKASATVICAECEGENDIKRD